jgi:membrane fusion protein (multidrug efflux system)
VRQARELAEAAQVASAQAPRVVVVTAVAAPAASRLELPGDVQPLQETAIRAQVAGYVSRFSIDIGARVEAGALLAEIDTPMLDQGIKEARAHLLEAQASLTEARANVALARTTLARFQQAAERGGVARQELDERKANVDRQEASVAARAATVESSQATIGRLEEQKKFARVIAPFAGTVTRRTVDQGALVSENGQELFRLARVDVLRVFVNVPQTFALSVQEGQKAELAFAELPAQTFEGRVTRTAGSLERGSRTLLTELQVENREGRLLPGMFARVSLSLVRAGTTVVIPANALLSGAQGSRVATVIDGRLHYQSVALGRDLGKHLEVVSGLAPGVLLAANLADELPEGALVDTTPLGK